MMTLNAVTKVMTLKLLSLPVPIILAILLPPIQGGAPSAETIVSPGTAGSLILATVALLLWFLNAIGKLPGGGGNMNRRKASFTEEDRLQLKKLTDLLAARNDDGMERILVMGQQTREVHECMTRMGRSMEQLAGHMEVLAEDAKRRA